MEKPQYINSIEQIPELSESERTELKKVTDKFMFRTNSYYQKLINWD